MTGRLGRLIARAPATLRAKLLAAFLVIVVLLIVVGAVGLQVLSSVNRRAEDLVKLQRKIAAYRQLQLGYAISSSLVGPVKRMDERFRQIASGDFSHRIDVPNRDELGTLAAGLNRMTEELGRLYREVEAAIGIAPEDQDAIFEEFRQVGRDDTQKREGTGLGLTLTRDERNPGPGSPPRRSQDQPNSGDGGDCVGDDPRPAEDPGRGLRRLSDQAHQRAGVPGRGRAAAQPMTELAKLLVVDDTPQNVKLLADVLRVKGYTVVTASSGREALELVDRERPDLVLLDVVMPEMSGYEVCQKIRANPRFRPRPRCRPGPGLRHPPPRPA